MIHWQVDSAPRLTRRDFCVQGGQALSLVTVAGMLGACGGSNPVAPSNVPQLQAASGSVVGNSLLITVGAGSPLASIGGAAIVASSLGTFLVAHTAQDTFVALTAICTHEACIITGFDNQRYVCPCHGSQFNTSGAVQNGPATTSLRQFAAQFANNVVTITV